MQCEGKTSFVLLSKSKTSKTNQNILNSVYLNSFESVLLELFFYFVLEPCNLIVLADQKAHLQSFHLQSFSTSFYLLFIPSLSLLIKENCLWANVQRSTWVLAKVPFGMPLCAEITLLSSLIIKTEPHIRPWLWLDT